MSKKEKSVDIHRLEYEVSSILASFMDIDSAAPYLLEAIGENLGWKIGIVWVLNNEKNALISCGSWTLDHREYQKFLKLSEKVSFAKGRGLPGKTWEKGEATFYLNINKNKNFILRKLPSGSKLVSSYCFPLHIRDEFLGVIQLLSESEPIKTTEISELFDTIGFQIAQLIKKQEVENQLKQTINQLKAIFRSVPDGLTVEDDEGMILYANDAVAKILGFNKADEIVGKNIRRIFKKFEITDNQKRKVPYSSMPAARVFKFQTDIVQTLLFKNKKTGEHMWLNIKATGVYTENSKADLAVKVFLDITEDVEEDKRKQVFVGLVSHEIKNPLTSIKAFTQLLIRRIKKNELKEALDFTYNIEEQIEKVSRIVNDLMDFTRISGGLLKINPGEVYIDDLINQTIESFKPAITHMKVVSEGKTESVVMADDARIAQVLLNLLNNASKYASSGKKIVVKTEKVKNEVKISVKDFGPGIPLNKQKEIFKLFTQGDKEARKSNGLGLGLYLSSAIVKSHNGKLGVKSLKGKGATFYFTLPIVK